MERPDANNSRFFVIKSFNEENVHKVGTDIMLSVELEIRSVGVDIVGPREVERGI